MEEKFTALLNNLDEFISGNDKDIEQLKMLAREVKNTYQQIPYIERYNTIQSLLLNSSGLSGQSFFHYLTEEIRQILNASLVMIAQVDSTFNNTVQTVCVNCKGNILPNFEYYLEYCPCKYVVEQKKEFFQQNIPDYFPEWSKKLPCEAQHYYGMPLLDAKNESIGVFIALFDNIPHNLDWAHIVLELMSGRVSLEIQHSRSENILKESERRMHVLLETITDYLVINKVRDNKIIESWHSPTCVKVTGYDSKEYIENPSLWLDMVNPDDKIYVLNKVNEIIEGKSNRPFEHRIIHKDGTVHWIRNTPIVFRNVKGQIVEINNIIQDITEIKQIELQLIDNEQQYRLLFNQMSNGFAFCQLIYDTEGEPVDFTVLDVNPEFEKIVGYSRERLVSKKASDFSKNILKRWLNNFYEVTVTKESVQFEEFFPSINKHLELTIYSPRDQTFAIILNDITENKTASRLLAESEQRYKTLVEFSPLGILVIQQKGIVYCNQKGKEMLEISDDKELESHGTIEFLPDKISKLIDSSYNSKDILLNQKETSLRTARGNKLSVELTAVPISFNSLPAIQLIISDISEKSRIWSALKESERRFYLAMEAVNDGVFEWDILNNHIYFSARNYTLLGYKPGEFQPNHYVWDSMIHPEDKQNNYRQLKQHLKGESDYYEIEYRMRNKNNEYQWILERGKILERDSQGHPVKIIGIHSDIDNRKKMEQNLRLAYEKAEESNKLKSAFIANMSHEIRTPMNGILGFSALLEKDNIDAEKRKMYLKIIQNSSRQLLTTVNNILDISKIESGQIVLMEENFDLNNLMKEVYHYFSKDIEQKKLNNSLQLLLKLPKNADTKIIADKIRLQQILYQLVDNAIKFTPEGTVEFGYKFTDNTVEFYVKDTGIGIPEDKHQLIFEEFRQLDISSTRKYGGIGVGLSICKGLVQLMSGNIWLESQPSEGSTFYFNIPLKRNAKIHKNDNKIQIDRKFEHEHQILIVDDVYENYLYLDEILTSMGAKVFYAQNGSSVFSLLSLNSNIDLVILDIRLPDLSGFDVFRWIRENFTSIPVIALTAFALDNDKNKIMQMGFAGYLSKPIDRQQFINLVLSVLGK
jgi:PAS domain S-box-containing protein